MQSTSTLTKHTRNRVICNSKLSMCLQPGDFVICYRPAGVVVNGIAICTGGLGLISGMGKIEDCHHRCDISSELCCPLITRFGAILRV